MTAVRRALLRLGLAAGRRARPRAVAPGLGLLLSDERRAGGVALVWTLGWTPDEAAFDRLAATLAVFETAVHVTDTLDFRRYLETGALFEALPGPAARAMAPGRDWPRYLDRRIARIRAAWQPDFEAVLAQSPEEFVRAAR